MDQQVWKYKLAHSGVKSRGGDGVCVFLPSTCSLSLAGYLYENSTGDMQFTFAGLNPYTRYTLEVRAKAAGEVGPAVQAEFVTPAEGGHFIIRRPLISHYFGIQV